MNTNFLLRDYSFIDILKCFVGVVVVSPPSLIYICYSQPWLQFAAKACTSISLVYLSLFGTDFGVCQIFTPCKIMLPSCYSKSSPSGPNCFPVWHLSTLCCSHTNPLKISWAHQALPSPRALVLPSVPPRAKLHSGFGKQTGGSATCERVCEFEFVCLWIRRKKPGLRCSVCAVSLPRSFLYSSTGIITPFYKVVDVITLALYIKML